MDHRRSGVLAVEAGVAITLLALIAVLVAEVGLAHRRAADSYLYRQAAAWAADAQLQRYQAGARLDSNPPAGLVPDSIKLQTRSEPAEGPWQGFLHVTVVATAELPTGKIVHEQVSGYVRQEDGR